MKISDNCPNDMTIRIDCYGSCQNGMDESDIKEYKFGYGYSIILTIRNGIVLPATIDHDMTLTPDNYYIIVENTSISSGVTVNVEPGTQIQFWSSDPNDAYAESRRVSLTVSGTLNCNGTKEEPIKLFPSDLYLQYPVKISGNINLKYCEITNPQIPSSITLDHCYFSQSFDNGLLTDRKMENGQVQEFKTQSYVQ